MTLIRGITYVFDCEVSGANSEPDVTWTLTRPSNPVPLQDFVKATDSSVVCNRPSDTKSYTLTADNTAHNDQTLTCGAANSAGSIDQTISLNVLGK